MGCPICDGAASFAFRSRYVDVMKCVYRDCGHLFAIGRAAGSGLQWVEDASVHYVGYEERNSRLIPRLVRDGIIFDGAKLLDFGAGTGHIAAAVKKRLPSVEISCLEGHGPSVERLRAMGFKAWQSEPEIQGEFDVLFMTEVIEHLDDPVATMTALRRHLKTGATLFLTTPCGEIRTGSRRTNAYDTKEHVHFFTERSLRLALSKSGFSRFEFHCVNEMHPRARGLRRPISTLKDVLRPLRAAVLGHHHLTGWARAH